MIACLLGGVMSYSRLGREEDPPFAIKTMVVQAKWPGATIKDTLEQVTDRIEKELQQLNALDYVRSYTTPGQTTVFVQLRDTTKPGEIQPAFYQVRKRLGDTVQKDEIVAVLDSREVADAKSEYLTAQVQAELQAINFARQQKLLASRSASEAAFETARAAYLENRLRVDLVVRPGDS